MRTLILCIAALSLLLPASVARTATAADLLILQSRQRDVYEQTAQQIRSVCGKSSETLVLSDYAEFDLSRIVREEQPRVVVAIGEPALKEARKLRRTDVVYALTLNVNESALASNVGGVSMHVAPENYLKLFKQLQRQRIGIIYSKRSSGAWLERARMAAAGSRIDLVPLEVVAAREVPDALDRLKNLKVDALWMIPDSTAVTPEIVDAYFQFAQQQNLPVFSFAKGYLVKGAVAVLEASHNAVAVQSCDLIRKVGKENPPAATIVDIKDATLYTNENVAKRLQLTLSGLEKLFPPRK